MHFRASSDRMSLGERQKTGSIILYVVGNDRSDTATDQVDKFVLPLSFYSFVDILEWRLVYFKPILTKISISEQTKRTIRQLEIRSARTRVCAKMQRHQPQRRCDDSCHQRWERHDKLQNEVRELLHRTKNGDKRRGTVREKLKGTIRFLTLSMGIRVRPLRIHSEQ